MLGKLPVVSFVGQHQAQPAGPDGAYVHAPNEPDGVAQHLACTAVDVLVRTEAPLLAQARSQLDALRVNQGQRQGGQAMVRQAVSAVAGLVEPVQDTGGLLADKVVVPRRPGRKTRRQGAPLAACAAHVAQGINDLEAIRLGF